MPNDHLTEFEKNCLAKPARGSAYLDHKGKRADRRNAEQAEMQAALKRDGRQCRWPGCHGTFRGQVLPIDPAHVFQHRGAGGNPTGDRTKRELIAALCRHCHNLLDAELIAIKPLSAELADGCLAFYQKNEETGAMEHIASEIRRGESIAVGA